MRVCLDASHSKLACNHLHINFRQFLDEILPHTAHLHLADAKDVDGEDCRSMTVTSTGFNYLNRSTSIVQRHHSFLKSGKVTKMAAKVLGWR